MTGRISRKRAAMDDFMWRFRVLLGEKGILKQNLITRASTPKRAMC